MVFGYASLKRKCCHFDEILITGCTGSCHFDNFQCSQWWKFHQNEDISVSVLLLIRWNGEQVEIYHTREGLWQARWLHLNGYMQLSFPGSWHWDEEIAFIFNRRFLYALYMVQCSPDISWSRFFHGTHNGYTVARPSGRELWCVFVSAKSELFLHLLSRRYTKYRVILGCDIYRESTVLPMRDS